MANLDFDWYVLMKPSTKGQHRKDALEWYYDDLEDVLGYVYLMHLRGTGFYKIGLSKDPLYRRVSTCAMPIDDPLPPIDLLHVIPTNQMRWLERSLHEQFRDLRIKGTEWFTLSNSQVMEIKQMEFAYYNVGEMDFL